MFSELCDRKRVHGVFFYWREILNKLLVALICGCAFGLFDYLIMLPNTFPDAHTKFIATWSAVIQGFSIGFFIPLVDLPIHIIAKGALVGALISTPSAIIVGMYPQIIGNGVAGGMLIGAILAML